MVTVVRYALPVFGQCGVLAVLIIHKNCSSKEVKAKCGLTSPTLKGYGFYAQFINKLTYYMSEKPKFDIKEPSASAAPNDAHASLIKNLKEKLKGKSVFIATPMFGGVCQGLFAKSMNELLVVAQQLGVKVQASNIYNESLINRARNYLLQTFLDTDMTHIMWIDADIAFNPYDVFVLLAYCDEKDPINNKPMDIVGGLYPKKSLAADKMVQAVKAGLCDENPEDIFKYAADLVVNPVGGYSIDISKPIQVSEIGTGFMMMSRDTVNNIRQKNPQLKYKPDHIRTAGFDGSRPIYNLFEIMIDPDTNRLLSEDYGFLRLAKKLNLNIFVFPWIKLIHIGSWYFKGSIQDLGVLHNKINENYSMSFSGPLIKKNKEGEKDD
jgi:hypothetical protein